MDTENMAQIVYDATRKRYERDKIARLDEHVRSLLIITIVFAGKNNFALHVYYALR